MKTFNNFISEAKKENDKGYFIDKDGYANPNQPIILKNFKSKKNNQDVVIEETKAPNVDNLTDLPGQYKHPTPEPKSYMWDHGKVGKIMSFEDRIKSEDARQLHIADREKKHIQHHKKISDLLHSKQPEPTKKQHKHLQEYSYAPDDLPTSKGFNQKSDTGGFHSSLINKKLIDNHKKNKAPTEGMKPDQLEIHNSISKLASHPLGHQAHLYSGVGFDPKKAAEESEGGILHLPAHMSTSHDVSIAANFADANNVERRTGRHIIHIDAKPTDRGFHVGKHSEEQHENETIIPAGTKLKYSHTTVHSGTSIYSQKAKFYVHHFTIHSQE